MHNRQDNEHIHVTLSEDISQSVGQPYNETVPLQSQPNNQITNIMLQVLKNSNKDKTKSDICGTKQGNQGQIVHLDNNQEAENIPEPLQSDEEQSIEAQYLSYIENPPSDEEFQAQNGRNATSLRLKLKGAFRQQFLSIYYQSVIYVRKQQRRTQIDDKLFGENILLHISAQAIPKPKSLIGNALLQNGYFLCAYAIFFARANKSPTLLRYILNQFKQTEDKIAQNKQEFLYYSNKQADQFHIIDYQQNKNEEIEKITKRSNIFQDDPLKRNKYERQNVQKQLKKDVNCIRSEEQEDSKFFENKPSRMVSTRETLGYITNIKKSSGNKKFQSPDC